MTVETMIDSRSSWRNPIDFKPLPGIIAVPSQDYIQRAYLSMADDFGLKTSMSTGMPPAEDLTVMAAMIVNEAEVIGANESSGSIKFGAHAKLLLSLYHALIGDPAKSSPESHSNYKARSLVITSAFEVISLPSDIESACMAALWFLGSHHGCTLINST